MPNIRQFRQWQRRNPNFMTPTAVNTQHPTSNYYTELSVGEFLGIPLYGVSVIHWNGEKFTTSHPFDTLPKALHDEKQAIKYFNTVNRILKGETTQ